MKKLLFISFVLALALDVNAQVGIFAPIDSIQTPNGLMLIYADRTWGYAGEEDFEGIMNERIHEMVCEDTAFGYKSHWTHDDVITCSTNDVSRLKDTLWMCVLDSLHESYAMPFDGLMTSKFGYRNGKMHNGVDIDLETGDTIYAAFDGKIRYAKYNDGGFGNLIVIRHYNGLETYYGHCSKLFVNPMQDVKAGDPIGLGGNTGRSRGSHLHFEVRFYDNPINPELIFDFEEKQVNDNFFVHTGVFHPSTTTTTASKTTASSATSSSSSATKSTASTHKVKSGDSLWTISLKYNTTVSRLCKLNGLTERDVLQIGQIIQVR
jgi:hypothetical protein